MEKKGLEKDLEDGEEIKRNQPRREKLHYTEVAHFLFISTTVFCKCKIKKILRFEQLACTKSRRLGGEASEGRRKKEV